MTDAASHKPDPSPEEPSITQALNADAGISEALPLVYDQLKRLAGHQLQREREGHTLSATALVHEAYLRLAGQDRARWQNRAQFYSVASTAMRRILVNHARDRLRDKRGGGAVPVSLEQAPESSPSLTTQDRLAEIVTVDRLLEGLAAVDARAARVVECRYFAGYTNEETADALGVSSITVKRAWKLGRAWLARATLEAGDAGSPS